MAHLALRPHEQSRARLTRSARWLGWLRKLAVRLESVTGCASYKLRRSALCEDLHPDTDPLALFQAVLALDAEHQLARFAIARVLLSRRIGSRSR